MTVRERDVETSQGRIRIGAQGGAVVTLRFVNRDEAKPARAPAGSPEAEVLREAAAQVRAWFAGERDRFDLPFALRGTPFQRAVWEALLALTGESAIAGESALRVTPEA